MVRSLLLGVLTWFFIARIVSLFHKMFPTKAQVAMARARFASTLCKLHNLKEEFYVETKLKHFIREDAYLVAGKFRGNPIVRYEHLIDEIENILYHPAGYLKQKVREPVSDSLFREKEAEDVVRPLADGYMIIMKPNERGVYSKIDSNGDFA
ncbi:MAG: hypothetical protein WC848_02845 [Parcubacteria group bacterium]|jgi:hypothetical protein